MIIKKENSLNCPPNSSPDILCLEMSTELSRGEAGAFILISEIFHHVLDTAFSENGNLSEHLYSYLEENGSPPYRILGIMKENYLKVVSGRKERAENIKDLIILWIMNSNPALEKVRESLISDSLLKYSGHFHPLITNIRGFFRNISPDPVELMLSPLKFSENSLEEQLIYILNHFGRYAEPFRSRILRNLDTFREEKKGGLPSGPGQAETLTFENTGDKRNFSSDSGWMPNVVMIAKSTYVWMDQLSKKYGYPVKKLDEIPKEEIAVLSERGINTLWLIGLWERSEASRKIKTACGNPEAAASAYSLKNYEIAEDLGGWESLNNFRNMCSSAGIRLASDMVPNHTGIDSDWIQNHPERFIQLPYSPFPGYSFNGPDLSSNPSTGIFLEDHYYTKTDAAVVFKYIDYKNSETRYIYHGNDGTSMPWNDTAQLNYLDESVREAVIETIIHVARNFPVIRFDAAMTLARKHIQRLWYPAPGQGGDIPSRSEYGMSEEEFNRKLPKEFWREVVERVSEEVPETLLLAEAFWMMEGYFVRNLGMHRVYNSSFMNMLKDEENKKYRDSVKNILLHDPEILKRFVNFMNNPDEETAARQFGKGDKYFGVCTMMTTLPGLPMFGHGQIEGFEEKYGMEYKKAYLDESPDEELIERHKREIFPLLKMRRLFSESAYFQLYDLVTDNGTVNEDVFAWSNKNNNSYCIVVYNNSPSEISGFITKSSPKFIPETGDTITVRLSSALDIIPEKNNYLLFTEFHSELTYIVNSERLHLEGLSVKLNKYENKIFLDFRQVSDTDGSWSEVSEILGTRGTGNIERLKRKAELKAARNTMQELFSAEMLQEWEEILGNGRNTGQFAVKFAKQAELFYRELEKTDSAPPFESEHLVESLSRNFENIEKVFSSGKDRWDNYVLRGVEIMPEAPFVLLLRIFLSPLQTYFIKNHNEAGTGTAEMTAFIEDLGVDENFTGEVLKHLAISPSDIREISLLAEFAAAIPADTDTPGYENLLEKYICIPQIRNYLKINTYRGIDWFKRETFQSFTWWTYLIHRMSGSPDINSLNNTISGWILAEEKSGCELNKLLEYCRI